MSSAVTQSLIDVLDLLTSLVVIQDTVLTFLCLPTQDMILNAAEST